TSDSVVWKNAFIKKKKKKRTKKKKKKKSVNGGIFVPNLEKSVKTKRKELATRKWTRTQETNKPKDWKKRKKRKRKKRFRKRLILLT
ncbi:conserved hypothetical protein, partial [Ixodes scapularis]